ncbi:MAG: RHS repeat domain-containing protein [Bacteroidota bacterium]
MKLKIITTFGALMASMISAKGQTQPQDIGPSSYEVQIIPQSPQVASLGKFGDIPMNKYNGTANINIPIHTIELDGLAIPLTLSYNTSGIRVEQEASWVGLGWNLSEGMVITREVNGFDDIYEFDANNSTAEGWIYSQDYLEPQSGNGFQHRITGSSLNAIRADMVANHPSDMEPDLYSLSTPNGSCKFYLPKKGIDDTVLHGRTIGLRDFIVDFVIASKTFVVTDPKGFVYNFTEKEYSTGFSSWQASPSNTQRSNALTGIPDWPTNQTRNIISAWKVSKITSPYNREIEIDYTSGYHLSYPHFFERFDLGVTPFLVSNETVPITSLNNVSASMNAFHTQNLTEIRVRKGPNPSDVLSSVRFIHSNERNDLLTENAFKSLSGNTSWNSGLNLANYSAKRLNSLEVMDLNGTVVKTVLFNYSYFNNGATDVKLLRLKLDNVVINDEKYLFTYNDPNNLPAKDTNAVDFWGFYNGIQTNTHKVPSSNRFFLTLKGTPNNDQEFEKFYKVLGANRSSDPNYSSIGVLNRVIYPTGGMTEYEYESNSVTLLRPGYNPSFYSDGQPDKSGINSSEGYNYRYQYLKLAQDPTYSFFDYSDCSVASSSVNTRGATFQVTDTQLCSGRLSNVKIGAILNVSGDFQSNTPSGRAVWLENQDTNEEITVFYYDNHFSPTTTSVSLEKDLTLPIGTYKLRFKEWVGFQPYALANVSASATVWQQNNPLPDVFETFRVGGLRVRRITNREVDGTFLSAREFDYTQLDDLGNVGSSGRLMNDLVYTSKGNNFFDYTPEVYDANNTVSFWSDNKLRSNPAASGSHIGYSRVIERYVDSGGTSNGSVVTLFSNRPNIPTTWNISCTPQIFGLLSCSNYSCWDNLEDNPCFNIDQNISYSVYYDDVYILGALPISHEHSNGSVLEETVFDANGNAIHKTENEYLDYKVGGSSVTYYPIMFWSGGPSGNFSVTKPYQKIEGDQFKKGQRHVLKQRTITDYQSGGSISSSTEYFYGALHNGLVKTININSSKDTLTTKAYYPEDLASEPFMDQLINLNRKSDVIKTEVFRHNLGEPSQKLVNYQSTEYGNSSGVNNMVLPQNIYTKKSADQINDDLRQVYEKYDSYGNLLQYRSDSGPSISFIWGYNGQYPVAKIENATRTDVETVLNEVANFDTGSGALTEQEESTLRNGLSQAMVTTYRFDPQVGVTQITDPKGQKTHFTYDTNNRLKEVRDHNNHLVTDYDYSYKTISIQQ